MMPLLTIITVTYNAERYLARTLESVQKALARISDTSRVEYLIIDGNSRDNTVQIANQYSFVSKIISEPDNGLYDAMNKGISLATGKFLWFLNAGDEVFHEDVILSLLTRFSTNADVYYSDAMLVKDDGTEVGPRSQFTPHNLPKNVKWQDFALGMKICHQAFIARHEVAPQYDITNLSADIDWEIQCLKKALEIEYLDFTLCRYLMGGTSITNHRQSLIDRFEVLGQHFGYPAAIWNHFRIFWRGFWFARIHGRYW